MKQDVFILSASDRFNYGDLLFPLIAQKELEKCNNYNFINVGIIASDLTPIGGLRTVSYRSIYQYQSKNQKGILLVAGGEVLGASWSRVYSFIYPWYYKLYNNFPIRNFLEVLTRLATGNKNNPIPFIPMNENILRKFDFIFHAVGGSRIFRHYLQEKISVVLRNSLYITARENKTYEAIYKEMKVGKAKLTPDTAILMSDLFANVEKKKEKYVVFQVGHHKNGGDLNLIKSQLEKANKTTKLPIYLLPLGNCPGHDDIVSLNWLNKKLKCPNKLIAPTSLKRIMSVIANSELFMGTSLHGIITAMAFNIPYMGLNSRISKLVNYLDTWAPSAINKAVDFDSIADNIERHINIEKEILVENSANQKKEVRTSFKQMNTLIQNR